MVRVLCLTPTLLAVRAVRMTSELVVSPLGRTTDSHVLGKHSRKRAKTMLALVNKSDSSRRSRLMFCLTRFPLLFRSIMCSRTLVRVNRRRSRRLSVKCRVLHHVYAVKILGSLAPIFLVATRVTIRVLTIISRAMVGVIYLVTRCRTMPSCRVNTTRRLMVCRMGLAVANRIANHTK